MNAKNEDAVQEAVRVSPPGWGWLALLIGSAVAVVLFLSGGLVSHLQLFKEQAEWETERTKREQLHQEWDKQYKQLQEQVRAIQAEIAERTTAKAVIKGEEATAETQLSQLTEKLTSIGAELDAAIAAREKAMADRVRAEQDQVTAQKEVGRLNKAISVAVAKKTAEEERMKGILGPLEKQETNLQAEIDAKGKQVEDLNSQLPGLQQQVNRLKGEFSNLQDAKLALEREEQESARVKASVDSLRQQETDLRSSVEVLRQQETALVSTNSAMEAKGRRLQPIQSQVAAEESKLKELMEQQEKSGEMLQKYQTTIDRLGGVAGNLAVGKKLYDKTKADRDTLQQEIESLKGQKSSLVATVASNRTVQAKLQEDVNTLTRKLGILSERHEELGALQGVINQLRKEEQSLRDRIEPEKTASDIEGESL